ncbi:hypothetical protein ACFYTF_07535 [Nocardia thailandica]|uniref:Deoxyribonuclease NucA/NucB domain-containing protein n=1 Tax=Nocardia thailandica TaxID=257275 RepID=A0ABW6PJV2_9NOCA
MSRGRPLGLSLGAVIAVVLATLVVPASAQPPTPTPEPPVKAWKATENPNPTIVPGKMRSDREEVPGGFSKSDADKAETLEAAAAGKSGAKALLTPGCQVYWPSPFEVCGAIKDKYNELGGPNSFLLWPTSNEIQQPDGIGAHSVFTNGPIYWSPWGGAHPVVNHFYAAWQRNGWEGGVLGYPTSDEIVNPDGIGRRQYFDGGTIYWKLNEAYFVSGAIRDKWGETGWEGGYLGYPISDEIVAPDGQGRFNRFENGVIYWTPTYGAHPVSGGLLTKWSFSGYEAGSWGYPVQDAVTAGSNTSQVFEYGTMSWPVQQIADSSVVDDGDIAPYVDGTEPVTSADFVRDSQDGVDPDAGFIPVGVPPSGSDDCAGIDCFDDSDLEEPNVPSADESGPIIDPICYLPAVVPPTGRWYLQRKFACMVYQDNIKVVGQTGTFFLPVTVRTGIRSSHNSGAWRQEFRIEYGTATGPVGTPKLMYELAGRGYSYTQGQFKFSGPAQGSPVVQGSTVTIQVTWNELPMNDGAVDYRANRLRIAFGNEPPYIAQGYRDINMSDDLRCDKTMRKSSGLAQGCVFHAHTPRWLMEPAVHPEAVGHVERAQQSGLPGGVGSPLHRQASVAERNNNRRVACPRGNAIADARRVPGRSCDEYPFASTREGAASNPNGRTFNPECHVPDLGAATGPTGHSACMIDNPQNLAAGGLLGVFYGKMRVIDNDAFIVLASGGSLPPVP